MYIHIYTYIYTYPRSPKTIKTIVSPRKTILWLLLGLVTLVTLVTLRSVFQASKTLVLLSPAFWQTYSTSAWQGQNSNFNQQSFP